MSRRKSRKPGGYIAQILNNIVFSRSKEGMKAVKGVTLAWRTVTCRHEGAIIREGWARRPLPTCAVSAASDQLCRLQAPITPITVIHMYICTYFQPTRSLVQQRR